jgi:hypothetical protein
MLPPFEFLAAAARGSHLYGRILWCLGVFRSHRSVRVARCI